MLRAYVFIALLKFWLQGNYNFTHPDLTFFLILCTSVWSVPDGLTTIRFLTDFTFPHCTSFTNLNTCFSPASGKLKNCVFPILYFKKFRETLPQFYSNWKVCIRKMGILLHVKFSNLMLEGLVHHRHEQRTHSHACRYARLAAAILDGSCWLTTTLGTVYKWDNPLNF